jgi:hypothetical protein
MIDSLGDVGTALAEARRASVGSTRIVDLSFAITHTTEPSSQRHHRVWLARVSEGGLAH